MNQFLKRGIHFFAISFFTLIIGASCDKDMSVMLDNTATSNVGVAAVDSFTVHTSTVQLWDIPSSGSGKILVGKANLPEIGEITSTSYFRIGLPNFTNNIPETAEFDSLNLVLKPSAHSLTSFFGDTTAVQKIYAHRMTEAMSAVTPQPRFPNEELPFYTVGTSLYTKQSFAYNPTPIGTLSFRPHVQSLDSVNMRLDQGIGQEFFDGLKRGDIQFTSNEQFIDYFKGLVLVPDEDNSAIVPFSDTLQVKVNYSFVGADGHRQTAFKELNIVQRGTQHNNITYNRTGTAFEELSIEKELPTSATGSLTYMQSGSGVVAKISFPSLKEFLFTENIAINKAQLVIETTSAIQNTLYPAPRGLQLFIADNHGVPRSALLNSYSGGDSREAQYVAFTPGQDVGQNGTYTFDLLLFLKQLRSTEAYDNISFYLSDHQVNLGGTTSTALIATENSKPKIKLNILYTKFK